MSRLKVWVLASRPKTLWAAVAPVIIGTALACADSAGHPLSALAAMFGAVMIQIGTNFANDYLDYKKGTDTAERLGPMRVTQAGLVKPTTMKRATALIFLLAVLAGLFLVWRGGWPIVVIGLCSILFGVLYTGGPYPLGYNGLGEIFVLIFFGPVAVGGTYYVQALDINALVVLAGTAPGLFSVAILTVNNLRDIDGDREAGKKTLAVRFGRSFSRWEYLLSIVIASLIPATMVVISGQRYYALVAMVVIVLAIPTFKTVFTRTEGEKLNNALAATGKLLLIFSLIFSIGWLL
ncbi:MAG: 1,4-dihydroxy-2-naphthoate polyprenyltransferase [Candidatus Zixiibacteriota bacterium]